MDGNVTNPYSGFSALIVVQVTEQIKNSEERERENTRETCRKRALELVNTDCRSVNYVDSFSPLIKHSSRLRGIFQCTKHLFLQVKAKMAHTETNQFHKKWFFMQM